MENRRIIRDMHCVSNKLSRQLDNLLSTQGITHMQFAILSFITRSTNDGKDVFQKNLEISFDIRPSSVSSILSLMEEKKLIKMMLALGKLYWPKKAVKNMTMYTQRL